MLNAMIMRALCKQKKSDLFCKMLQVSYDTRHVRQKETKYPFKTNFPQCDNFENRFGKKQNRKPALEIEKKKC